MLTEDVEIYPFRWVHNGVALSANIWACKQCICHCANVDLGITVPETAQFNITRVLRFLLTK